LAVPQVCCISFFFGFYISILLVWSFSGACHRCAYYLRYLNS
jgi:hypothetical protein